MRTISRGDVTFRVADGEPFWDTLQQGTWEPDTLSFLDRMVSPGTTVVDIGAWMGPITLSCAARGATCHSFEPDPVAFGKLSANVGTNEAALRDRIHLNNMAVTPDGRPVRLFTRYHFGDSGSTILTRVQDSGKFVEVASTTFDGFLERTRLERIDLVKMDIEGGEFLLLPTMRKALERFKPVLLIAVHLPYIVEHFEKQDHPIGAVRWLRRTVGKVLGTDPQRRSREKAQQHLRMLLEALSTFTHVYTPALQPVPLDQLIATMQEPTELVFSPRAL